MQKLKFFGMDFLCKCERPILKKVTIPSSGSIEYVSIVQNRTECSNDSEILIESFSDDDEAKKDDTEKESSTTTSAENADESDLKTHSEAAEIRRLLRRKDELERKERMMVKYNERLQVSKLQEASNNLFNSTLYHTQEESSEEVEWKWDFNASGSAKKNYNSRFHLVQNARIHQEKKQWQLENVFLHFPPPSPS